MEKSVEFCPLCNNLIEIEVNRIGIHCEGLVCGNCGCNARNRFFYHNLLTIVSEKRIYEYPLKVLEASSFGYVSLGTKYIDLLAKVGADVLCSDYYERNFKATIVEDLTKLSFEDEYLDIICHSHVLEHIEDDIRALQECSRCLKPGGVLFFSLPIQTDFTYRVSDEYHGDGAYVYRRNGWDLVQKLKSVGFHVEIRVPPEHVALQISNKRASEELVLDNIKYGDKFGINFNRYLELFYRACDLTTSEKQRFGEIWPQLEMFVAVKSIY